MSLLYWLPLISNAHNQGCSENEATLVGNEIIYEAGKIGNAATFPNSANNYIHLPGLKLQIFSWCCWFKCISQAGNVEQRILSEGKNIDAIGTNIWVSDNLTLNWATHKKTGSISINPNTWYHVALTCNDTSIKFYLNGELKSTTSYTENSDYTESNDKFVIGKMSYGYTSTNNYFPFYGQINDVRVYNHCLSIVEIKQLTQGLILHWKLDNLNFVGSDSSGYNNIGIVHGVLAESSNAHRYLKSILFDGNSYILTKEGNFSWYKNLKEGTISAWIRPRTNKIGGIGLTTISSENTSKTIGIINYENKLQLIYSNGVNLQLINTNKNMENEVWHFCAITFQLNGTICIYFDGEKVKEESLTGWDNAIDNNNIQFQAGINLLENNSFFQGEYNDVRLYITPLLDKDIKMLYNTNMRIDNFSKIYSFEFKENTSAAKLTYTGILTAKKIESTNNGFIENGNTAKLTSKYEWYSSNFVEY